MGLQVCSKFQGKAPGVFASVGPSLQFKPFVAPGDVRALPGVPKRLTVKDPEDLAFPHRDNTKAQDSISEVPPIFLFHGAEKP